MTWPQLVTWVLIVAGWWLVNYQNNARETRKEVRASLVDLYKHLDAIEDAAFSYHTGTGALVEARRLKRDITQIAPRIVMLRRGPMVGKINYARPLFEFRKSITFENFDTKNFAPKGPQDPFFDNISASKRELIAALESAYSAAYP